ncbi:MAG: hypothetical protein R3A80_00750 [Bdellovibrionota bacterium]
MRKISVFILLLFCGFFSSCSKSIKVKDTNKAIEVDPEEGHIQGVISYFLNNILPVARADSVVASIESCVSSCAAEEELGCAYLYLITPTGEAATRSFCSVAMEKIESTETESGFAYSYDFKFKDRTSFAKYKGVPLLLKAYLETGAVRESVFYLDLHEKSKRLNVRPATTLYAEFLKKKLSEASQNQFQDLKDFSREFDPRSFEEVFAELGFQNHMRNTLFFQKTDSLERLLYTRSDSLKSFVSEKSAAIKAAMEYKKTNGTFPDDLYAALGTSDEEMDAIKTVFTSPSFSFPSGGVGVLQPINGGQASSSALGGLVIVQPGSSSSSGSILVGRSSSSSFGGLPGEGVLVVRAPGSGIFSSSSSSNSSSSSIDCTNVMGPFFPGEPCSGMYDPNYRNDTDGDGVYDVLDCDPNDPSLQTRYSQIYVDQDLDGFFVWQEEERCFPRSTQIQRIAPSAEKIDCDDTNPAIASLVFNYVDKDRDGYYVALDDKVSLCGTLAEYSNYAYEVSSDRLDCNDEDSSVYKNYSVRYVDKDADGFFAPIPGGLTNICGANTMPLAYSLSLNSNGSDCNDDLPAVNRFVSLMYQDKDRDGLPVRLASPQTVCENPNNPNYPWVVYDNGALDCNDNDPLSVNQVVYRDFDADGIGAGPAITNCSNTLNANAGYSLITGDLDDKNKAIGLVANRDLEQRVLVVYNENVAESKALAQYYVDLRSLGNEVLCGVRVTASPYTTYEEFLGAKKRIVEQCLCKRADVKEAFPECNISKLRDLDDANLLEGLVLIKGVPFRLTNNYEEPALAYFLREELFKVNSAHVPKTKVFASHVEGLSYQRAKEHLLRSFKAEQNGYKGNVFSENISNASGSYTVLHKASIAAQALTGLPSTVDVEAHPCLGPQIRGESWDSSICRAGATKDSLIPGQSSYLRNPLNAGLFLGSFYGPNGQGAFNSRVEHMLNWKKSAGTCYALCSEFPNEADQAECRSTSLDYKKEINTDCVGGSDNFMGFQYRSWTVQNYGIYPKNWYGPSDGQLEHVAPEIITADDAYHSEVYTDNNYLRFSLGIWMRMHFAKMQMVSR